MSIRENTFLLKRSNVPGKVPFAGDVKLGEIALNTADVKLYASGTTENDIVQIGWDRINRTGDTVTGDFIFNGDFSATTYYGDGSNLIGVYPSSNPSGFTSNAGTVTSVGLSMPSAFTVTNSPVISAGTLTVAGAGLTSQYVRGDGSLANFPASTGGGASLSFYLNGSISQGTFGGISFREMDRTPILGPGTDFTINTNGYIQSFITDAGVPNLLQIPAGNWNFETYFSSSSNGGTPSFYVELYKWNGTTLTLIASNSANPEGITNGTVTDLYVSALAVPQTTLLATDRLAVRIYVNNSGRTIKLHTEDNHLCQVITTFSTGITALNGLTTQVQNLAVGTTGTDFTISSIGATHTFNLPTASATNRGALSSTDWTTFNGKQNALGFTPVTNARTISTTSPLSGGGDLTANRTLSIADAVADDSTKGAASFSASDFNSTSGNISIDYTNGQTASASAKGFLTSTDWSTFNGKQNALGFTPVTNARTISTTSPLSGGGDLTANRTFSIAQATTSVDGYLSATDWTTFNNKANKSAATTGVSVAFATPQIYNTRAAAATGNITGDYTNAIIGVVQKIYHNDSVTPTFPGTWVKLGSGVYIPSTLNIIYVEWTSSNIAEYWIVKGV
jgi:hypothetical protein